MRSERLRREEKVLTLTQFLLVIYIYDLVSSPENLRENNPLTPKMTHNQEKSIFETFEICHIPKDLPVFHWQF